MATMSPGEQTTTAYSQVKAELPKAIADLNATIAKAATLSDALKKYNLTLSAMARNVLNRPNYSPPSGDLSSPFFGAYRSLAGFGPFGTPSTYNRRIDIQLRLQF